MAKSGAEGRRKSRIEPPVTSSSTVRVTQSSRLTSWRSTRAVKRTSTSARASQGARRAPNRSASAPLLPVLVDIPSTPRAILRAEELQAFFPRPERIQDPLGAGERVRVVRPCRRGLALGLSFARLAECGRARVGSFVAAGRALALRGLGAVLARALVLRPSLALFLASAFAARLLVLVAFAGFASRPLGALLVASVRRRFRIRLRLVLLLLLLLGGLLFGPQTQQRLQVASRHLVVGITLQRGPEGRDGARQIALLRVQVPQAVQGLARGPARGERPRKGLLGLVVSAQRAQRQATVPVDLAPLGARPGRAVEMRE